MSDPAVRTPRRNPAADFYEFGPFRLEVPTRSLYRQDEFVPVTPKAFDTLLMLLEAAGRLVTKEELLQRIWPDTFVEEGSIANNISALRKTLNPYFDGEGPIVTVARRGYRFTAPVQLRNAQAQIALVTDSTPISAAPAIARESPAAHTSRRALITSRRDIAFVGAAVLAIVALGTMGIVSMVGQPPAAASAGAKPNLRRAIAVLPMKNLSGNSEYGWFSTALTETLSSELAVTGELRLISGAAVAEMQQELRPQPGLGLSRKQLDEIGRTLGCDLILTGNYLLSGGRMHVDVRLDDIQSAEPVASVSAVEDEQKLLQLVAVVSRDLRTKLGVSPPLASQSAGLRAALSSNPNALRFYFLGLEALRVHEGVRSSELLAQAITEDPNFALAHSVLSITWRVLGYDLRAQQEARRAFELSASLAREDQLGVEGAYYEVMGDVPKAIEKYQSLWNFYPDNIAYALKLMHQLMLAGRLDDARGLVEQMRALPPPADGDARVDLVETDLAFRLGNLSDALAMATSAANKASVRKASQLLSDARLRQGAASGRLGALDDARRYLAEARQISERLGAIGRVSETHRADAGILMALGQAREAERAIDTALALANKMERSRQLTEIWIVRSGILLQLGKVAAAKADAELALAAGRREQQRSAIARAQIALGGALHRQGDHAAARTHLDEGARLARDIGERRSYTLAVNALAGLDLAEGRIDDARRRLDQIVPIDREQGDKSALALSLANLSAVMRAQKEFAAAVKTTAEECAIYEALGAEPSLDDCHKRLTALRANQS